jgi:hypothetical protein
MKDVVQNDYGVIQKHTDTQRQTAESHHIKGKSAEINKRESSDHRNRNCHADYEGCGDISQEQKYY